MVTNYQSNYCCFMLLMMSFLSDHFIDFKSFTIAFLPLENDDYHDEFEWIDVVLNQCI